MVDNNTLLLRMLKSSKNLTELITDFYIYHDSITNNSQIRLKMKQIAYELLLDAGYSFRCAEDGKPEETK